MVEAALDTTREPCCPRSTAWRAATLPSRGGGFLPVVPCPCWPCGTGQVSRCQAVARRSVTGCMRILQGEGNTHRLSARARHCATACSPLWACSPPDQQLAPAPGTSPPLKTTGCLSPRGADARRWGIASTWWMG